MSIDVKNITYSYLQGTEYRKRALSQVSLSIKDGEWVIIMGSTGSGKSTLLQHLNGLLKPESGEVFVDGVNIHDSRLALREARRKVGVVFQYPEHQIFGSTVYEEVAYGPENFGFNKSEVNRAVQEAMEKVGLSFTKYKDRSPFNLSGGEKRRVALAGVLAAHPKVIALDEPTVGLDQGGKELLIDTIKYLNRDNGITIIWVTHEIEDIAHLAQRLVIIENGTVAVCGSVREVLSMPSVMEMGLNLPAPVEIAHLLRQKNINIVGQPLTLEEIKKQILRLVM